jgi:hypothetical protein
MQHPCHTCIRTTHTQPLTHTTPPLSPTPTLHLLHAHAALRTTSSRQVMHNKSSSHHFAAISHAIPVPRVATHLQICLSLAVIPPLARHLLMRHRTTLTHCHSSHPSLPLAPPLPLPTAAAAATAASAAAAHSRSTHSGNNYPSPSTARRSSWI